MKFPILINWISPFLFYGLMGGSFHFYLIFNRANCEDPDQTPHSAASDLGLPCLPMSHKKDARLIRVNICSRTQIIEVQNNCQQGCVCGQNICYHIAANVVSFSLICNMTIF